MKDRQIFSFAGLFDAWINLSGEKVSTCTIITTKPNELVADIHDRMPVILRREDETIWLDRQIQDVKLLQSLLVPYATEDMFAYPVSSIVGNVKNDGEDCVDVAETDISAFGINKDASLNQYYPLVSQVECMREETKSLLKSRYTWLCQ